MFLGQVTIEVTGPYAAVRTHLANYVSLDPSSQSYLDGIKPAILDYVDRNNSLSETDVVVTVDAYATQHFVGEDSEDGPPLPLVADGPLLQSFEMKVEVYSGELVS